ncbi:Zinc/iron permease [Dentipellis sp. KUC8613]|nr:Zinc/iron permease [Dentipellis sp. KUC8613]
MLSFFTLFILASLLGLTSFGVGILPLSFSYSKTHLARLSALGTGLLLGTALGVVVPEGIETILHSGVRSEIPAPTIGLSLLVGFSVMLLVEQLSSSHAHGTHGFDASSAPQSNGNSRSRPSIESSFDVELGELENEEGIPPSTPEAAPNRRQALEKDEKLPAYPLTIGLVFHGLTDGFALGASALSSDSSSASNVSFIVFLALIIHKVPTALAFTTSLLSTSLSRVECRRHLMVFSSSTPAGAIVAYSLFSLLGLTDQYKVGIFLLISVSLLHGHPMHVLNVILQGGSFLYVATVLQPVSDHNAASTSSEGLSKRLRISLVMLGMFIPFVISGFFEHEH